jgi:hypothetical protein
MVFVDLDWVPGRNLQAEDRIRRIGQKAKGLEYIRLVVDHAIDRRVLELLDKKARLIEGAIEAEAEYIAPEPPAQAEKESDEEWQKRVSQHQQKLAEEEARRKQKAAEAERLAHLSNVQRILNQERQRTEEVVPEAVSDPTYRQMLIAAHKDMLDHCDGAKKKDEIGFSAPDAPRAVALTAYNLDTVEAAAALWLLLRRYRRQLSKRGHNIF